MGGVSADGVPIGPTRGFLLGADRIFRDELARLASGARVSLGIGVAATAIATGIGGTVGIVAGWFEGSAGLRVPWFVVAAAVGAFALVVAEAPRAAGLAIGVALVAWIAVATARRRARRSAIPGIDVNADLALMRLVDALLAFPFLLLVMAIGAAREATTAAGILATLGLTGWLGTARIVRAKTLEVRALGYVEAARALGQTTPRILFAHVLPNVSGPLVVIASFSVAQMILAESVLSYLGVGLSPPTPTWGRMLFEGQDYYLAAPWLVIGPGCAILLAVLGFNLLGEGLRDALDPRA